MPLNAIDQAARVRAAKKRDHLIPFRRPADPRRRRRLERDPAAWLRWYLPGRFPLPFGPVHLEIIAACHRAITTGTSITVAAPRGFGKTALLWGMAFFASVTGLARFPVVIGWKRTAGVELLDQWLDALSGNDRLADDYPCVCDPFRASTASKRLQGMLRSIDPDRRAGCDVRKSRGIVVLPTTDEARGRKLPQCAMAGASINGSIKGLNVGLLDGEALRPDIVLLDDPQDVDTAESEALVEKVLRRIDFSVRSLSGPRRRLTLASAVTTVATGDVSEHLLSRPGTEAIRIGQILAWPTGWEDEHGKAGPVRLVWDAWNTARLEGLLAKDGGKAARVFYREHKAELTAGMKVSWEHRYHEGDATRPADPDAMFAAMWDFYDLGEAAFMAERQNQPIRQGTTVYTLTPEVIQSRADESRQPLQLPSWAVKTLVATDINHYGLSTTAVAFGNDQTAAVIWYGIFDRIQVPENAPESERRRIVFEMLTAHEKEQVGRIKNDLWIIDGGYEHGTVQRFAEARKGVVVARGYGATNYKPFGKNVIGTPREQCHEARWPLGRGLAWNADYWREVAQRAWLGSLGAPGSCSLPAGHHKEFSDQVCRERLAEKLEGKFGFVWRWLTLPGKHDLGDAMAMCYMGAAWTGIGTGGVVVKRRYVEQRKAKVGS